MLSAVMFVLVLLVALVQPEAQAIVLLEHMVSKLFPSQDP